MQKKNNYGIKDLYQFYIEKYDDDDMHEILDYDDFSECIRLFNDMLVKVMILECFEFKAPYRNGRFRIKKYRRKLKFDDSGNVITRNLPVHWPRTKKVWQEMYPGKSREELKKIKNKPLVYNMNEHTDGYQYVMYWSKVGNNIKNNRIYEFIFTYTNRRFLAQIVKENPNINYYE